MKIVLNGEARELSPCSLAAALPTLGFADAIVATAVNGEFVPGTRRAAVHLKDGDHLEVLAPMQGG